jgi:ribokinase
MPHTNASPRIAVCGSINMDLVVRTERFPAPGETRLARSLSEIPGGKGANQAVAIARLGMNVSMLGAIGDDGFATTLLHGLQGNGVDTGSLLVSPGASGVAFVAVDDFGQNSILVLPGANGRVGPEAVDVWQSVLQECDWLVLQLEMPLETVEYAIAVARRLGKQILLNPAPAPVSLDASFLHVDLFCPNQTEAEAILNTKIVSREDGLSAAIALLQRGPKAVVITLGCEGAVIGDSDGVDWIPAHTVTAVDTTAAGDAFIGALVTRIAQGADLRDACRFATAAAAHAVTIAGAQPSLPTWSQVRARMDP